MSFGETVSAVATGIVVGAFAIAGLFGPLLHVGLTCGGIYCGLTGVSFKND